MFHKTFRAKAGPIHNIRFEGFADKTLSHHHGVISCCRSLNHEAPPKARPGVSTSWACCDSNRIDNNAGL